MCETLHYNTDGKDLGENTELITVETVMGASGVIRVSIFVCVLNVS